MNPRISVFYISKIDAMSKALNHAGASAGDIRNYRCEHDTEDLIAHYEIESVCGKHEYEYEINAKTGKTMASNKEFAD